MSFEDFFNINSDKTEKVDFIDVREYENKYIIVFDFFGYDKKDIEIRYKRKDLIVKLDKKREIEKFSPLKRKRISSIKVPDMVDIDDIQATFNNGILEVILFKKSD